MTIAPASFFPFFSTTILRGIAVAGVAAVLVAAGCNAGALSPLNGVGGGGNNGDGSVVVGGSVDLAVTGFTIDLAVTPGVDMAVIGAACGFAGQSCCQGSCYSGACCVNNACIDSGQDCGNGSGTCRDGQCSTCGANGQACCANNTCADQTACCAQGMCVAEGQSCGGMFGSCAKGSCSNMFMGMTFPCGAVGEGCCATPDPLPNYCTAPGTVCGQGRSPVGICQKCGNAGDPCCTGGVCGGGGCCVNDTCIRNGGMCGRALCVNGACGGGTCGNLAMPCCTDGRGNSLCTGPNTRCLNNTCQHCGGKGDRCCNDPFSGDPIVCNAPYQQMFVMQGRNNVCYCQ